MVLLEVCHRRKSRFVLRLAVLAGFTGECVYDGEQVSRRAGESKFLRTSPLRLGRMWISQKANLYEVTKKIQKQHRCKSLPFKIVL